MISRICLVCYDISSNKTRREIVKLLSDYGKRVQESVFLCDLPIDRVKSLDNDLRTFYARKKHRQKGNVKTDVGKAQQLQIHTGGKKNHRKTSMPKKSRRRKK